MLHALVLAMVVNCEPSNVFTGTICAPASAGKHPAILLLGGSEGGDERMSAVAPQLAQHGYVAAAVAYFGMPGLPRTLENIPVESVGNALTALEHRSDVDPNRIAILGVSKGGELALLAASVYPQIRAVIADVASPFAWQGMAQGPGPAQSSWTFNNEPLPYVHFGTSMGTLFSSGFMEHKPLAVRPGYDAAMLQHEQEIAPAMFHLEKIRGPVLMLAAGDDQVCDSVAQSELGMRYLREHEHPYADDYVEYAGAGHLFLLSSPQNPLTQAQRGPLTLLLGGTPQANVAAAAQAWPRIFTFLDDALR